MQEFGELLRHWRKTRGLSQLSLGLEADISARHLSFLETGRAQPSREMVIRLAGSLDIPLSERNTLLSAAGFAEAYSRMPLAQAAMQPVRRALEMMLANHAPYPAVVLDWDWNILMANAPQQRLAEQVVRLQPDFPDTRNILELLFDPRGYRPFIENWHQVAFTVLQRLQRERLLHQDRRSDLLARLLDYPDVPASWREISLDQQSEPMVHVVLAIGDIRLKLFSTLASFGTPIDITMQELVIEQYFPVDEATRVFFENQ